MTTTRTSAPSTNDAGESPRLRLPNIAVIGKAGAGKSSAAEYLEESYEYGRVSFAAKLKAIASELWGTKTDRDKLQKLGVAVRDIQDDTWVKNALNVVDYYNSRGIPVVIDDCRFPNEYWALKERGSVFIRLWAPEETRIDRLMAIHKLDDREQLNHISERAIDDLPADYTIENSSPSLDHLRVELKSIVDREVRRR